MKKLLVLCLLLYSISSFAQKTVESYYSSLFDKNYDISVSLEENNPSEISVIYIDVKGETSNQVVSLRYTTPYSLLKSLKEVREKYAEWIKIAEENNITDMTKEIPVQMPSVDVCWYGTKWFFAFNKHINFTFMILDSGSKVITMYDKVTASSNKYIDQKFYWVFQSVEELDEFISKLDYPKFIEKLNTKSNNSDLFQ